MKVDNLVLENAFVNSHGVNYKLLKSIFTPDLRTLVLRGALPNNYMLAVGMATQLRSITIEEMPGTPENGSLLRPNFIHWLPLLKSLKHARLWRKDLTSSARASITKILNGGAIPTVRIVFDVEPFSTKWKVRGSDGGGESAVEVTKLLEDISQGEDTAAWIGTEPVDASLEMSVRIKDIKGFVCMAAASTPSKFRFVISVLSGGADFLCAATDKIDPGVRGSSVDVWTVDPTLQWIGLDAANLSITFTISASMNYLRRWLAMDAGIKIDAYELRMSEAAFVVSTALSLHDWNTTDRENPVTLQRTQHFDAEYNIRKGTMTLEITTQINTTPRLPIPMYAGMASGTSLFSLLMEIVDIQLPTNWEGQLFDNRLREFDWEYRLLMNGTEYGHQTLSRAFKPGERVVTKGGVVWVRGYLGGLREVLGGGEHYIVLSRKTWTEGRLRRVLVGRLDLSKLQVEGRGQVVTGWFDVPLTRVTSWQEVGAEGVKGAPTVVGDVFAKVRMRFDVKVVEGEGKEESAEDVFGSDLGGTGGTIGGVVEWKKSAELSSPLNSYVVVYRNAKVAEGRT
ncbi:hypothetical protein HDV00_007283 [Rhizophlyctis rosea]|nr:hypothetical protein HDV00_007283 [Rhizophlyctis rosea]